MPQIFREKPPLELVEQCLKCFGLHSLSDPSLFTKSNCELYAFESYIPLLEPYYIPCKAKEYLYKQLTPSSALTILRQLLHTHSYSLLPSEKSVHGKKSIWYSVSSPSSVPSQFSEKTLCISFD